MAITDPNVFNSVSTSTTTPWATQQPYLNFVFDQAKANYASGGPQYYPNSTVTPFSAPQEQALGMIQNRATAGSPVTNAAQNYLTGSLNGDYLNNNPYLDSMFNQAAGNVRSKIDSQFAGSGRYGSGAHQGVMGQTYNDLATNIYGQNYQNERNRQSQNLYAAPSISGMDYYDYGKLFDVGNIVQQQGQRVLDDNVNRYNYNQNLPDANLQRYGSYITGNYGNSTTNSNPMYSNSDLMNSLGFGLAGSQIGKDIFGLSPWIGGLIGGIAGLL